MTSTIPTLVARAESTETITTMPMSSIFTAPASCSNSWTYEPEGANNIPNGILIQNAHASDNADPACFPSGYSQYERVRPTIAYSPGYCPGGYTSADLVIHNPVTTAMCCPSDFSYYEEDRGRSTFAGCISSLPSSSSTIVTVRQVESESTQVIGPVTMWAQPIQIQLQASDESLFVSATTTTSSETSPGSSATPTQTGPADPTTSDTDTGTESSGLSTGASIGIGVGVGVGGLVVIAALAFWLFRRRQNKAKKSLPDTLSSGGSRPGASELGGSTQFSPNPSYQRPEHATPSELGGSQEGSSSKAANTQTTDPSELEGNPGQRRVHELGA
ncbi:hypothetical protein N7505_002537 [Penicillium chrysogenum]|uniref:Carcinoembryonic antigen-related cell adhesion molecule n=1 Tax=Penicillium chrysogenum TaxID=5076 RepID=A0ABQ8X0W2_PENCH|nr:hypothetical protein N7505_002537 [Penicillium chrysogenum]